MADVKLVTPRDYWVAAWQWITGASASKPKVRAEDLEVLIGEKADEPTANTLLARIKSLEDKLTAVDGKLTDGSQKVQLSGSNVAYDDVNDLLKMAIHGSIPLELAGRNVVKHTIIDPATNGIIRHTDPVYPYVDISPYKKIYIIARSTLNQDVTLEIRPTDLTPVKTYDQDTSSWVNNEDVIIPSGDIHQYLINTKLTWLNDLIFNSKLYVRAQCSVAPTSGELTVNVFGLPN